ncbi:Phosphatidylinositide phosphatase SAC1-B [Nymphon striatum]|nr:Phosphatidylinositide phosphatase SAC1-B [Nymphon striatum]
MVSTSGNVFEEMTIYLSADKFYIEPVESTSNVLVIDRGTSDSIPAGVTNRKIFGVIGVIQLLSGPYLIVITKRAEIGTINKDKIWKVVETDIIAYSKTDLHLTEKQIQDNKSYLSMLNLVLTTPYFYFSTKYDLTHTIQRLYNTSPEFLQMPLHERADQRFLWNGHLLRDFIHHPELHRFCLPLIHGFISMKTFTIKEKSFNWIIISRRKCFRAGSRLFVRGLDQEGNAANFVETEQIIEWNGNRSSFVQTRGSIPLFWSQRPNLKYKPQPVLDSSVDHMSGFSRHFDTQVFNYGRQVIVNLIDHKGSEKHLEEALANTVTLSKNPNIRYESFDFHKECSKMRWHRLNILLDRLVPELEEFGYFQMNQDGSVSNVQTGVLRTNCMDCLDRTNVVQSMLAHRSLEIQLRKLSILLPSEHLETNYSSVEQVFKNIWADNADLCSIQYAGTGALKTDFTRTGKRTKFGLIKDGINSLKRYYKNNFSDGFRQDAVDLFLGNYIVDEQEGVGKSSPLQKEQDWKYLALPIILLIAIAMSFVSVLLPGELSAESLMYFMFWIGMSALTLSVMCFYGSELVDQPKLCEVKRKVD